jgi:hypothetical protein
MAIFRFTIRDVLWLTVVVATGVGWWVERRSERAALSSANARADELEWKLKGCRDMFAEIGFELQVSDSSIHVSGNFPDGSASKGITQFK